MTQEGKAWEWWISAGGLRCGGEKPRERRAWQQAPRRVSKTLKWSPSLRKVSPLDRTDASRPENREVVKTTRRECLTHEALGWRESSEDRQTTGEERCKR